MQAVALGFYVASRQHDLHLMAMQRRVSGRSLVNCGWPFAGGVQSVWPRPGKRRTAVVRALFAVSSRLAHVY
jgi:hypothetical protein